MPAVPVKLRKFIGVNRAVEPRDLGDNELFMSRNMVPVQADGGELMLRLNSQWLSEKIPALGDDPSIQGRAKFFSARAGGVDHVLAWETPGRWYWLNPQSNDLLEVADTPESQGQKPSTVQWREKVYCFTGGSAGFVLEHVEGAMPPFRVLRMDDGARWGNVLFRPKVASQYRGSILLAGFGGGEESLVRWCEPGNPDKLSGDAKSLLIGAGEGGDINGAFEVTVEGGDQFFQAYGVILKPGGMWMIQGLPPTSTSDGDLQVNDLSGDQGLVSHNTIVKTKYGTIWCSGGDVWIAPIGQKPVRIGEPIRPLLETTPQITEAFHAVYHNGFYRLTIPRQNYTGMGTDYGEYEQWWADMRMFPARVSWWGPMEVPTDSMITDGQPGYTPRLLALTYRRMPDYRQRLDVEEHEVNTDGDKDHWRVPTGTPTAPQGELRFREIDGGDPSLKKIVQAVETHVRVDVPQRIEVKLVGEGGGVTSEQGQDVEPETQFHMGDPLDSGRRLGGGFRTVTFTPPEGTRYLAHAFQPVLTIGSGTSGSSSSWVRFRELTLRIRVIGRRPSTRREEAE